MWGDGIAIAHRLFEALAHVAQQLIAGGVAKGIIDVLEIVEIEQRHGRQPPVAVRLDHGLLQAVVEDVAIGQDGKRIVMHQKVQALLGLLALGNVARYAEQAGLAVLAHDRDRVGFQPAWRVPLRPTTSNSNVPFSPASTRSVRARNASRYSALTKG